MFLWYKQNKKDIQCCENVLRAISSDAINPPWVWIWNKRDLPSFHYYIFPHPHQSDDNIIQQSGSATMPYIRDALWYC